MIIQEMSDDTESDDDNNSKHYRQSTLRIILGTSSQYGKNYGVNFLKRKSDYVQTPILKDGLESIRRMLNELGKIRFIFNPYGGEMSEISSSSMAFLHRAGNIYKIMYTANWHEERVEEDRMYMSQIRSLYSFMTPFVSKNPRGAHLNYRDLDIGVSHHGNSSYNEGNVYGLKYFLANFERLMKVKTVIDPDNFFRNEPNIPVKLKAKGCNNVDMNTMVNRI